MPRRKFSPHYHITTMTMNQYVTYNEDYKVLICRQHKHAVPPDWILRHFRDMHQSVPLETREAIVEYSESLHLLAPNDVVIPTELSHSIQGLEIRQGYQCQYYGCLELCSTENSMKKHCRVQHKWMVAAGVMWNAQSFQTFFVGKHNRYNTRFSSC
jgi:hypothetical protein